MNQLNALSNRVEYYDRLVFYLFDILYLDGFDLRDVPLIERKNILRQLLDETKQAGPRKYSEHLEAEGPEVYRNACKMELEGIVSKRKNGRYRSGRNEAWVKVTCQRSRSLERDRGRRSARSSSDSGRARMGSTTASGGASVGLGLEELKRRTVTPFARSFQRRITHRKAWCSAP